MRAWLGIGLVLAAGLSWADIGFRKWEEDPDAPKWAEDEVVLPAFPADANLMEFYVSPTATNRFFVDGSTLSVGKDGVVHYVLVIRTSGGASNISFEGIHCSTREYKIYATGRSDGTWAKGRSMAWRSIENNMANRYHAALSRELFCPIDVPIATPEEGRNALRLGKHPMVPR